MIAVAAVNDDSMTNTKTFYFFGPQLSVIYGQFFAQAEYQYGQYDYSTKVDGQTEDDFSWSRWINRDSIRSQWKV